MRKRRPVVDFNDNLIEVGDRYFYGSPPTNGVVIQIKHTSIVIETEVHIYNSDGSTMNCKSPDKGICIDKVPI